MKILNEKEQLEKKREDLFNVIRFHAQEREDRQNAIRKKENKFFPNRTEIQWLKHVDKQMMAVESMLHEYKDHLNERLEALKKKQQ